MSDYFPSAFDLDDLDRAEQRARDDERGRVPGYGLPDESEPHDCREFEVEHSTTPTRSGRITVHGECEVCGRITTPPYHDTIL